MIKEEKFKQTIRTIRELEGLPDNAETLSFDAPWKARLFSLMVTLYDMELFEWDEFRSRLEAEMQDPSKTGAETPESPDYDRWMSAFEKLLDDKGICEIVEIDERTDEFSSGIRDASEFVTSAGKHGHTHEHHQ